MKNKVILVLSVLTWIDDLNLLFLGLLGLHAPQLFPTAGTPDELPQPNIWTDRFNVKFH